MITRTQADELTCLLHDQGWSMEEIDRAFALNFKVSLEQDKLYLIPTPHLYALAVNVLKVRRASSRLDALLKVFLTGADVGPRKGLLIDWLVPSDRAEDMLLELQKAFEERWVPKYGARRARRILMMHSIGSVIGFWINWMMKHLSLLKLFASGRG